MPGFGQSPENTRTRTTVELGATMGAAMTALGIERFNLMATSFGGTVALWLAVQQPDRVAGPGAGSAGCDPPAGHQPPAGTPEEIARLLYAHPERLGALPASGSRRAGEASRAGRPPARARSRRGSGGADARPGDTDPGAVRHARPPDAARDGPLLQGAAAELPPGLRLRRGTRDQHRSAGGVRRGDGRFPASATRRSSSVARKRSSIHEGGDAQPTKAPPFTSRIAPEK